MEDGAQPPPTQDPPPPPPPPPPPTQDPPLPEPMNVNPTPPTTTTSLPSPQPPQPPPTQTTLATTEAVPPPPPPSKNEKGPPDAGFVQIQQSSYYKMRSVLSEMRPYLLEMLHTVDFRSCKGSEIVREKLKLLMELNKQVTAEMSTVTATKNVATNQPLPAENGAAQKQHFFVKPSENKLFSPERQQTEDGESKATFVVGGSAFGWNFITFPGNNPIYYGRTKVQFRAAQVISLEKKDYKASVTSDDVQELTPMPS